MTESEAAELAREVVRELFTDCYGRRVSRLVQEDAKVRTLAGSGWSERAAMAHATDIILKHSKKMGMGKRR